MAFFIIDTTTGRFGRELVHASKMAATLRDDIDLHVARLNNMTTDAQAQSMYGTTLTRAQLLSTLEAAQTQLAHASIAALATQIG